MENELFVVKYSGPFGFIKPWTAVRDSETFSQQFLTPSIIEGIEKKLFPELLNETGIQKILGHRLNYCGIDIQQEKTWAKGGIKISKNKNVFKTNLGIINRGVMLYPHLYLVFASEKDANLAFLQSICLCRNEDLLFPEKISSMTLDEFEQLNGFELEFKNSNDGFKVGHNRFDNAKEMFGFLKVIGNPIRND